MSEFSLLVAAMTVVALLFVVPPLLRYKPARKLNHDEFNTAVIKQQLAELITDMEAGKLDKTAYTAARHDLERTLLDDTSKPSDSLPDVERSGRWASVLLALLLPAAALLIYDEFGSQNVFSPGKPVVAEDDSGHSLDVMIDRLAKRLQDNPDDIEGWVMLATSYIGTNQFSKAARAYKQALQQTGDDPQLLTEYADALAMANGGEFTDEIGKLLQTSLQLQPENVKTLWLLGHWHYQRSQYQASLTHWQKAAKNLPADSQEATVLSQQIELAQNKLGLAVTEKVAATASQAAAAGASVQVTVSLDPSLKDKTSPADTLFIFARAAKGPRMPLAIVRKQVKDLPVTVTLDDSQAMSQQMVLSKFSEVSVGARISKTGNAMPSSGDLMGNASPISTRDSNAVKIIINQAIP